MASKTYFGANNPQTCKKIEKGLKIYFIMDLNMDI